MRAFVAFLGTEQAQARLKAAFVIGELSGEVFTGILPVGNQIAQYQRFFAQIEYPQAACCRGLGVVDHGQVLSLTGAVVDRALHRTEGTF